MTAGNAADDRFRNDLQNWRHRRRWTQQQLADMLGYDLSYIAKIEGGARPPTRAFRARVQVLLEKHDGDIAAPLSDVSRPPLPQPPDRLIGRDQELDDLHRLLQGPARCVSLVGPPGIGKTRLALEVAVTLDKVTPDGVWWFALADLDAADAVADRIRRSLGLADQPGRDPEEAIFAYLRTRRAVLILDNFEQVMDARGLVSRLVATTYRDLKVVVTSRERLDVHAEHVFPVHGLSFPKPRDGPSFATVRDSPAVALFVARATMARPSFELTATNFGSVLRACARHDGIPLGIVLAAGAVRSTGAANVADLLDRGLDLAGGPRDWPKRHASMDTAIGASWTRLTSDEQELLAGLSVFVDGFTAAAAGAVTGVDDPATLLDALCRVNLVEAQPDAPGGARCGLLDTIRRFAHRQLSPAANARRCAAHAEHFEAFTVDAAIDLLGAAQTQAAAAFAAEFGNVHAAFAWCLAHRPAGALRIAASAWRFFVIGDMPIGRRWLAAALAGGGPPTPDRTKALAASGALAWMAGDPAAAAAHLADAAASAQHLALDDIEALVLVNRGALAEETGDLGAADHLFRSALARYQQLGDRRGQAVALNGLGVIQRRQRHPLNAWQLCHEAAALFRAVGDGMNEALALGNKEWAAETMGRMDEAEAISHERQRIQLPLGDLRGLAGSTAALGRVAFAAGDFDTAQHRLAEAFDGFHHLLDLPLAAATATWLAAVADRRAQHNKAVCLLAAVAAQTAHAGIMLREDEQGLLDQIIADNRRRLDPDHFAMAWTEGTTMTFDDLLDVAHRGG